MKIYYAGDGYDKLLKKHKIKNILKSYYYVQRGNTLNTLEKVSLDSGGFSAWSRGVEIDINEYCSFIKKNKNKLENYFVLDDINCWKKTLKNQKYMEQQNLNPIPCYHSFEPLNILEDYCKKYKHIAIGGLVPYARNKKKLKKILDTIFKIIKKHFPIKVHGFGMTGKDILERYPFYSVDSTSWLAGAKTGKIKKFDKKDCGIYNFILMDKNKEKNYVKRTEFMLQEQLKLEIYITKLWKKRGINWDI